MHKSVANMILLQLYFANILLYCVVKRRRRRRHRHLDTHRARSRRAYMQIPLRLYDDDDVATTTVS